MFRKIIILIIFLSFTLPISACTPTVEETPTQTAESDTQTEPTSTATISPIEEMQPVYLVPEGDPNETYIAPFPVTVSLDGDLSDWEGVPQVSMGNPDSTQISFAVASDGDLIYFMADVLDSAIISGEHGDQYWNEDSVEFYINGTGDLSLAGYTDGVAQITVPPLNIGKSSEEIILAGVRVETTDAEVVVSETEQGYAVELSVPVSNDVWDIPIVHNRSIGFNVHLNGSNSGSRDIKLIWSAADQSDQSYFNPGVFGQLIFAEIGNQNPVGPQPTATPVPTLTPLPEDSVYLDPNAPIEDRIDNLIEEMSIEEKIGQMTLVEKDSLPLKDVGPFGIGGVLSGGGGYPETNTSQAWADMVNAFQREALNSRLGIPIIYGVDAVHGHNNVKGATIFPHNIGLGAANDQDLMTRIGQITAQEMIATGIYWNYAPAVSIPQDIRWGRTYEGYSEDGEIVTKLATAYLLGLQGDDLSDPLTVLATPKHFLGDGGTAWGTSNVPGYLIDRGDTQLTEAQMRELHLLPYIKAIENGAQSIMVSFSSWNGEKMHGQKYWITDVLKGELGFDGFVVSDWGGVDEVDSDYYIAVVNAINAGIDMNMVPYDHGRFIKTMLEAVVAGDIPMTRIDDAVSRILRVKYALNLFEQPYSDPSLLSSFGSDEHRAIAQEAVAKSLVLLKDEGSIFPISKDVPYLYIGGSAMDDIGIQSGGWTITWQGEAGDITPGTTILEAIENTVSEETQLVINQAGQFPETEEERPSLCLAVVGETPYAEGVGDNENPTVSLADKRALNNMEESCDKMAVILISGRPLIINDRIDNWDALVAAWLPGTEGQGVADVIFGDVPFTGKLSFTWPVSTEQLPMGSGDSDPLFPIGFGLVE
ncbi:MAG: glycoside hydrolase family 3 N-terminal domain-containing protein [Brevefilum sp.]|nr:glycoside hydrolase family 3 N-terminal domain-containing protein [Brevefilum sp.]